MVIEHHRFENHRSLPRSWLESEWLSSRSSRAYEGYWLDTQPISSFQMVKYPWYPTIYHVTSCWLIPNKIIQKITIFAPYNSPNKQTNNRSDDIRPSLQGPGVEITRRTLEGAAIRRKVSHRAPIPASSRSGENIWNPIFNMVVAVLHLVQGYYRSIVCMCIYTYIYILYI